MSTIIHKTNQNQPNSSISIQDGTSNSSWSSLILFGKNFANWGPAMNNNMVGMIENFANISPPPNPTSGQLWYDTTSQELKIYDPNPNPDSPDITPGWNLINARSIQGFAAVYVKNHVYVSANGNDNNDGLSWFRPKLTIQAACRTAAIQIGKKNFTPGHVAILVASGEYIENCPIVVPEGVAIIGDNLRSVTVKAKVSTSDVFHLNSKCYVYGITVRGHSLSPSAADITPTGYAGASGANLPLNTHQTGWAFSFNPGATINVSPYIQNCSSISGDPATGSGSVTGNGGGGILVDGSIIDQASRIYSIVIDAFTQINLGGIGVKVVNNGFSQLVSFFVNFCQFGILCVDGGHTTALNSNCSFGNYALWSHGGRTLNKTSNNTVVNQKWTGDNSTTSFVTTAGTYVAKSQYKDFIVRVNGVIKTINVDYTLGSISGVSTVITFNTPPSSGAVISAVVQFGSLIEASGYTMSYAGAGTTYGNIGSPNDLSIDQGGIGIADPNKYTIVTSGSDANSLNPSGLTIKGRIYQTTTDEGGNFYVGIVTPGAVDPTTQVQGNASPTFRINQQAGTVDGRAFYQSIFGFMTPFVLALTRKN
jgi:hypothetical protein